MKKLILFLSACCTSLNVPALTVALEEHNTACGQSSGWISSTVFNGIPPYSFLWSTGATTDYLYNIPSGTYSVTVHDGAGDSATASTFITDQPTLSPFIVAVPRTTWSCFGQCTGKFIIGPEYLLGTPPYTVNTNHGIVVYDWPQTDWITIDQLCPGDWTTVTITDALGCTGTDSQGMVSPDSLNPTLTITPACGGTPNGSVAFDNISWYNFMEAYIEDSTHNYVTGPFNSVYTGTPGYSISDSATNLLPGNYFLKVTYQFTDYFTPNWLGCPQYAPFTIPDLGTSCGTVSGDVFIDNNTDCIQNTGDVLLPGTILEFTPGPYYAITNSSGHYNTIVPWGSYTITQYPPVPVTQLCPSIPTLITLNAGNPSQVVDFADSNNISTVEGDVYVDLNANCIKDGGEISVPNTIIEFTPGPWYAYTDNAGHYKANLPWGSYNMIQHTPVSLAQLCPASPFPISLSSTNTTDTVNFADTSIVPFDVNAHISHGTARPGFNFSYGVGIQNLSYTPSGILTVTLNYDPLLSFVSASPAPFSTSAGQVIWQLSSITNFNSAAASVTLNVPANPALIGDTLTASVSVSAASAETNLTNNTSSTWHIIRGSFDPNEKNVEQPVSSFIPGADGLFNYTIQFQNTGNDTAFNVEIIDTLNSNLDVITFVPGASSHTYSTELTGQGVVHFHFNNINLVDSTTNEANSHGFVSFQIRSKATIAHGSVITNTSNIVFDFNPPVATNTTQNTVDLSLAIQASSTSICEGQSTTLTMIPDLHNITWRWYTGNCLGTLAGSGNSISVSPTSTTTYYVRDSAGTIPTGSCYFRTIVVIPNPAVPVITQSADSLVSDPASSYQWYFGGVIIPGATSQSYHPAASGNYSVVITDANNCSSTSADYPFILTRIQRVEHTEITIYPLPVINTLFVSTGILSEVFIAEIYDVPGKKIHSQTITHNSIAMDVTDLSAGIYILIVRNEYRFAVRKFIKQ